MRLMTWRAVSARPSVQGVGVGHYSICFTNVGRALQILLLLATHRNAVCERSYSHSGVGARCGDLVPAEARLGASFAHGLSRSVSLFSGVGFPATTSLVLARLVRGARHALPGVLRPRLIHAVGSLYCDTMW